MIFGRGFLALLGLLALGARLLAQADPLADRVIILANSADSDSVRLAHYYAEKRQVPVQNIFEFAMPRAETITWLEFVSRIWQPLQDHLVDRGWIDAVGSSLRDDVGRKKYAISGHRVAYLVVCRGVPLRIGHDPSLPAEPSQNGLPEIFRTNQAAVDSELALLAENHPAVTGCVLNPLFQRANPSVMDLARVVKVSRLDGTTFEDARGLIDHALSAEQTGLMGRAYVDIGGIHAEGDRWLESTVEQLRQLDFDLQVDRSPQTFAETARFDAPALYFGWYASELNGPFALPGFRFPSGAIALHIHSFSADTLRSTSKGWSGPLVARGVTATVGNVFEPYLQLTHRPDFLIAALARGDTWGDAAAFACPAYSWQAIALGDPLYRPFKVPISTQLITAVEPGRAYAIVREANRLTAHGEDEKATALIRTELERYPSLVLAWALANKCEESGRTTEATKILKDVTLSETLRSDEWALVEKLARVLVQRGEHAAAVAIYRVLLAQPLSPRLRLGWLSEAIPVAAEAKQDRLAAEWQKELAAINPPQSENK